jgi:hypothetical protein
MVTVEQIKRGLANYADAEIGQKATGPAKFMVYFAIPSITSGVDGYIDKLRSSPLSAGMFDEGGNVNLDVVHDRAADAMRKCGFVELAGIRFREADIDRLREYIEGA